MESCEVNNESDSESPMTKRRGKGFPIVPLPEARRILEHAGRAGTQHSLSAFAAYMGHQTTNSGAFKRRIAGLKDWGLITARGQEVEFTDLGKRIALPPDPGQVRDDLRMAFRRCEIFERFYNQAAKNVPLDEAHLGNAAVLEQGIAPQSKDKFVRSFVDSAIAIGLAERRDASKVVLLSEMGEPTGPNGDAVDSPSSASDIVNASLSNEVSAAPIVLRLPWRLSEGELVLEIRLGRPLPPSAFSRIGEISTELEALATLIDESGARGNGGEEEA